MTAHPRGWHLDEFRRAYAAGVSLVDTIDAVLRLLDDAPPGVLVGPPLHEVARADARRLADLDPATLPLYGVPFAVKDNIDVAGAPTTAACPGFAYLAEADATVVRRLRAAGAIPVAKANLDQFATGLVGTRSPYGVPPNAIDPELVPGGSSSGSAVAVALGLVPVALGTDTAGSGRVPAALNAVVGVKPTVASASTAGIVPAVRRLDCPTVFAARVDDATLVASLMSGPDADDPFSRTPPQRPPFATRPRIGVPRRWPAEVAVDPTVQAAFDHAIERLADLGCELVDVDPAPFLAAGTMLYGSPLVAERTVAVGPSVDRALDGLDPVVVEVVGRGAGVSGADVLLAEHELVRRRATADAIWGGLDALAMPTTPFLPTLAQVHAAPITTNEELGRFTTFANLLDLCAVVVPVTPPDERSPFGLQLLARAGHDLELARLASGLEHGALVEPAQPRTLVVVGAHLSGQPLHGQLAERRASLVARTTTTADYRLYALADTSPPKPGLLRVPDGAGAAIEVEVWSMGDAEFGSFVAQVPPPLCIGTVRIAGGEAHHGFLCEPIALDGATDITEHGGWRRYLASRA